MWATKAGGFGHPSFSLAHTAFELRARHLRICQLLTPGLKVGTHFHQTALCIAHLGSERIERQLEIDNFRLYNRFQLAAGTGGKGGNREPTQHDRS